MPTGSAGGPLGAPSARATGSAVSRHLAEPQSLTRAARRLGLAALGLAVVFLAWQSATRPVDFPIYHRVARQILHGDYEFYPVAVYGGGIVPAHGFRYAPAVAFLFVPLGLFPLEAAALIFLALKFAAFWYVGVLVASYLGLPGRRQRFMLASLLFVGGFVAEEFRYGNFHFFSVALMTFAFVSAERGKVIGPSAALGVAIAAKLTPLLVLAYFALRRRIAVCAATIGVVALIGILPAALVGFDQNNHLIEGFARYAVQKIDEADNYALRGALFRYLTPDHRRDRSAPRTSLASLSAAAVTTIWVLTALAGGALLLVVLWNEPAGQDIRILEFSLILTAMLLWSPHTQRRYFIALYVPVLALLAVRRTVATRLLSSMSINVALAMTAATSTFLPMLFGGRRLALVYESLSPYTIATLVLFVSLAFLTVRLKSEARRPL